MFVFPCEYQDGYLYLWQLINFILLMWYFFLFDVVAATAVILSYIIYNYSFYRRSSRINYNEDFKNDFMQHRFMLDSKLWRCSRFIIFKTIIFEAEIVTMTLRVDLLTISRNIGLCFRSSDTDHRYRYDRKAWREGISLRVNQLVTRLKPASEQRTSLRVRTRTTRASWYRDFE